MKVLLLALFVAGMAVAVLVKALGGSTKPSPKFRQNDGLDTVDEMFLYGEVNNDDFYRM